MDESLPSSMPNERLKKLAKFIFPKQAHFIKVAQTEQ